MTTTSHPQFKYLPALFVITAKTNLHSGSGGENYGIIDKMVQRDPASGFPCIYASSLKGALKEFFRDFGEDYDDMINYIFGNERKADEEPEKYKQQAGNYRFLQADLLMIPKPSDHRMFNTVTSPALVNHFNNTLEVFKRKVDLKESIFGDAANNKLQDPDFIELISDFHLPVIARNNLEDGQSTNLWYEQVLPRETKLFFIVLYPNPELGKEDAEQTKLKKYYDDFCTAIEGNIVQIGANASVGYGLCSIEKIEMEAILQPKKKIA